MVDVNVNLPYAVYISDGYYAISTRERVTFSQVCKHGVNSKGIVVKPPIQLVKLDKFCFASSDNVVLPAYFHEESNYGISTILNDFVIDFNVSTKLREPLMPFLSNYKLDNLPSHLKDMKQIPIDKLYKELQNLSNVEIDNDIFPNWAIAMISFAAALIFGILIFLFCKKKFERRLSCFKRLQSHGSSVKSASINDHVTNLNHEFKLLLGKPTSDVPPSAPQKETGTGQQNSNNDELSGAEINNKIYPVLELANRMKQ